jgi:hypothetical protein
LRLMREQGEIEINAVRRMLKSNDAVCGGVITGTDKVRSGYGNGDCLCFDFEHSVFAIADGTERFPWASRDLLNRLLETLSRSRAPATAAGWKDMINNEVYAGQKYQHKTTFSCVAVTGDEEGANLVVVHGGDSVVTVMNATDGTILFQTGADMNFAGRSMGITDATGLRVDDPAVRIIISSDGFNDLFRFCLRRSLFSSVASVLTGNTLSGVCGKIHEVLDGYRGEFEHDDIGFVFIDPFRVPKIGGMAALMGGTGPAEERNYLEWIAHGTVDRWLAREEWNMDDGGLSKIGIIVKGG